MPLKAFIVSYCSLHVCLLVVTSFSFLILLIWVICLFFLMSLSKGLSISFIFSRFFNHLLFLICPATARLILFLLIPEFPTFPHLTKSKCPMPIQRDKSRNTRIRLPLTCPNPFPHDKHEQELLGEGGRIFLNPTESRLLCKYKHHSLSY